MKKTLILLCKLVVVMVLCITDAQGQAYTSFGAEMARIREKTRFQIGPFRLFPRIFFREIGYDDNIFRRPEDQVSDYIVTVAPGLSNYVLYRDSLILSFTVNPEYVFFFENSDFRGWNNTYMPAFRWKILNRFVLSGNYINSRLRMRPSAEFDERADFITEGYSGSIFYEMSNNTAIGVSASRERLQYESAGSQADPTFLGQLLNRKEDEMSISVSLPLFTESQFFMRTEYTEYEFDRPESFRKNSYSYQILSGIAFPLYGNLRGTLSLGYKWFFPKDKAIDRFSGLTGNTGLGYRVSRLDLRMSFSRDIPFSIAQENIYFIRDQIGGGVSFYFTSFLRVDGDIGFTRNRYPDKFLIQITPGDFQEIRRKDDYWTYRFGIVFRVYRNTGFGIGLNLWDRDSTLTQFISQSTFIGLILTSNF